MMIVMVLGTLGLSVACKNDSKSKKPELLIATGILISVERQELYYNDSSRFGSGKIISVPVTFLELQEGHSVKSFILADPHALKVEDVVQLTYLSDTVITGKEIWKRYYPEINFYKHISVPNVNFKVDEYIKSWKK